MLVSVFPLGDITCVVIYVHIIATACLCDVFMAECDRGMFFTVLPRCFCIFVAARINPFLGVGGVGGRYMYKAVIEE